MNNKEFLTFIVYYLIHFHLCYNIEKISVVDIPSIAFHFHFITFECVLIPLNECFYQEFQNALTSKKREECLESYYSVIDISTWMHFRLLMLNVLSYFVYILIPTVKNSNDKTIHELISPGPNINCSEPLYAIIYIVCCRRESNRHYWHFVFTFHFAIAWNGWLPWQCNNNLVFGSVTIHSLHCSMLFDSFVRSTYWTRAPRGGFAWLEEDFWYLVSAYSHIVCTENLIHNKFLLTAKFACDICWMLDRPLVK